MTGFTYLGAELDMYNGVRQEINVKILQGSPMLLSTQYVMKCLHTLRFGGSAQFVAYWSLKKHEYIITEA